MTSLHRPPAGVADPRSGRRAWAEVDLAAIANNLSILRSLVAPSGVWAVVKADGYGHGATAVARSALAAGAEGLCVALVQEGLALRRAGIEAPILVLSEQPVEQLASIVEHDLTPTLYSQYGIVMFAAHVRRAGRTQYPVHLKIDTGMHRVGVSPADVAAIVGHLDDASPTLVFDGVFTHLACADEPNRPETGDQLEVFTALVARLQKRPRLVHAANSAGAIAHPRGRLDLVRAGISLYGISPGPDVAHLCEGLRPALSLRAQVSFVKVIQPGGAVSYGGRWVATRPTVVATVPLGYADGVPRRLGECGGEVLIGGRRRRILGSVTMDQIMVDCGEPDERGVRFGDEVVLLGRQGNESIRAEDWAELLGTIAYEIVCGISARVERRYVRDGHSLS